MLYCEFGPDGVGFFAERDAGARALAGDLVVRILLGRALPEGASSERAVLHYAAYERRASFRDAPSAEIPLADAGRTIGELIGSGFSWGYVAIDGCRCEILLSAFDGLVTLFWPTPDAWSIDQWEALTLGILHQAREAGAKLRTNLDAVT